MAEGEGVRASRARKRRIWKYLLVMYAAATAVGALILIVPNPVAGATLPPFLAIIIASTGALSMTAGVWFYLRLVDEVEYKDNLIAFSVGFVCNLSAYFAWYVLNEGGLASRPDAGMLFFSTIGISTLVYGWLKLKRHI